MNEGRFFVCEACEAEAAGFVERQRLARVDSNMRRSGLPLSYQKGQRGFADVKSERGVLLARALLAGEVRGMYLYGTAGQDKTTLACATLAELIRDGATGRYENALDLMMDISATYNPSSAVTRQDIVVPLINTHALLLDDFGKEKGSEHSAGVIYQLLDGRYSQLVVDSKRALIIVSNHSPADACARFGDPTLVEPILRRISELTVAWPMNVS